MGMQMALRHNLSWNCSVLDGLVCSGSLLSLFGYSRNLKKLGKMYAILRNDIGRNYVIVSTLVALEDAIKTTTNTTHKAALCDSLLPIVLSLATGWEVSGDQVQYLATSRIDLEIISQPHPHLFIIQSSLPTGGPLHVPILKTNLLSNKCCEWIIHHVICQSLIHASHRLSADEINQAAIRNDVINTWAQLVIQVTSFVRTYGELSRSNAYKLRL